MRSLSDPIVSSHILFVGNAALYVYSGFFVLGIALLINCIASFLYHLSLEKNLFWRQADHTCCIISLLCIFYCLFLYSNWLQVLGCVIWLALSLVVYRLGNLDYQFYHSIWHGCVFFGNVLVWGCLGGFYV